MKIQDAKPGDVLMGPHGTLWMREHGIACALAFNGVRLRSHEWCTLEDADRLHGPFTRLVREKETP